MTPDTTPILSGLNLSRAFGTGAARTLALRGVSLELRRGEFGLLMGPSGSGKSTLLAVLSGLLRPDEGHVEALGQDIWRMSESDRKNFRLRHCGFIFQGYNLFPALTARQQLELVLDWGENVRGKQGRERATQMLTTLGMGNKLNLRPAQLSGGEKQRVAIGRALIKNPAFCFADEPTSALDWSFGRQVVELLQGIARERRAAVLVVSHDVRLVPYADRIFDLKDGYLTEPEPESAAFSTTRGGTR